MSAPEAAFDQALTLLTAGQPVDALEAFAALTDEWPNDPRAWRGYAQASMAMNNLVAAEAALDEALALAPDDPAVQLDQLKVAWRLGRGAEALAGLGRLTTDHDDEALALLAARIIPTITEGEIATLTEDDRKFVAAACTRAARHLISYGDWPAAVATLELAVAATPNCPRLLNDFAGALASMSFGDRVPDIQDIIRIQRAIEAFLRASALGPELSDPIGNLGAMLATLMGQDVPLAGNAAKYCLRRQYVMNPTEPAFRQSMADTFYAEKRLPEAAAILLGIGAPFFDRCEDGPLREFTEFFAARIATIEAAIPSATAGDAKALYDIGQAFDDLGQTTQAAGYYALALKANTEDEVCRQNLGSALARKHMLHSAVSVFTADESVVAPNLVLRR